MTAKHIGYVSVGSGMSLGVLAGWGFAAVTMTPISVLLTAYLIFVSSMAIASGFLLARVEPQRVAMQKAAEYAVGFIHETIHTNQRPCEHFPCDALDYP